MGALSGSFFRFRDIADIDIVYILDETLDLVLSNFNYSVTRDDVSLTKEDKYHSALWTSVQVPGQSLAKFIGIVSGKKCNYNLKKEIFSFCMEVYAK